MTVPRWRYLAALLALGCSRLTADPAQCFAAYLTDTPPKIVEVVGKETADGVEVTRLRFLSRQVEGTDRDVVIYGVLARPAAPTGDGPPYPAVLVTHGGGGSAVQVTPQVVGWAKRGYVSFCQDQPGICSVADALSSGPCLEKGATMFGIKDSASESNLYDGVAAALNGLALLRSQPDVDQARVGVTGGSWGGYMCTMVTGLAGARVRASFSVYGCGYYDVGSAWADTLANLPEPQRQLWLDNLDAGRAAHGLTADHFVASPANDWFFWPSAVMRTLADVPGPKNWCFMPNESHMLSQPGGMIGPERFDHRANRTWMEVVWLNHFLKGEGEPFPTCGQPVVKGREGNAVRVEFQVQDTSLVTAAHVCYAAGELAWRLKWWDQVEAQPLGDGRYTALVPVAEPEQPLVWFGLISDERSLSVSTLIQTLQPQELGFSAAGYPVGTFVQDFEAPAQDLRWRKKHAERRPGRLRILPEAAHSGGRGLDLDGEATFACWGLRAATLQRAGATRLKLWLRAVGQPCAAPDVDLLAETATGHRYTWRWADRPQEPLSTEWQLWDMALDRFEPQGRETPPMALLSPELGQLRFETVEATHVQVDDLAAE